MKKLNWILAVVSIAVLAFYTSCDKVKDNDLIQPTDLNTTIYVQPNGSALIDLATLAKNGTTEVKILQTAQKGSLTIEQNKWLKYMPSSSFKSGEDNFSLLLNNKETAFKAVIDSIVTADIAVKCKMGAQYDKTITAVNTPVDIKVLSNDAFCSGIDMNSLQVSVQPKNGSTKINNGVITYIPSTGFKGMDMFVYTISATNTTDGSGSAEVYVYVEDPAACQVVLNPDYFGTGMNNPITIDVLANDVFCNKSAVSVNVYDININLNGSVFVEKNMVIYKPNNNFVGYVSFGYQVKDVQGNQYNGYVKGEVKATGLPDTTCKNTGVMYDKIITKKDVPVYIDVLANDKFCSGLDYNSFQISAKPSNGEATITDGKIIYRPNNGFVGTDKFVYSIKANNQSDGSGLGEVYVYVEDNNICNENLLPDYFTTTKGVAVTVDVFANDVLCSASKSTLFIHYYPQNGSVTIENGKIVYKPNAGYVGWDKLLYAVTDAKGNVYYGTMYGEIK